MRRLFAVIRTRGHSWRHGELLERQADWTGHASFMNGLVAGGFVVLGGPLDGTDEVLLVVRAETPDEVHARFAADPWTENGLLRVARVSLWTLRLGALDR